MRSEERQLWLGGAVGPPAGIPPECFVSMAESRPEANGYLILSISILRGCPWGTWEELRGRGARVKVEEDRARQRVLVHLHPDGERGFGKMPGWISHAVFVRELTRVGLVQGRHAARWERVAGGGWVLAVYPRVLRQAA